MAVPLTKEVTGAFLSKFYHLAGPKMTHLLYSTGVDMTEWEFSAKFGSGRTLSPDEMARYKRNAPLVASYLMRAERDEMSWTEAYAAISGLGGMSDAQVEELKQQLNISNATETVTQRVQAIVKD